MILILLKLINLKIINSIHNSSIYVSSESCEYQGHVVNLKFKI